MISAYIVDGEALNYAMQQAPGMADAADKYKIFGPARWARDKLREFPQNQGIVSTLGAFNLGFDGQNAIFNPMHKNLGFTDRVNLHGMPYVITGLVESISTPFLAGGS